MRAPFHPLQGRRLAALHQYDILDTPREKEFDDVVDLVARLCEAPISVVNLIDADRQWFKAETGLGVRETPLETSICSHVILEHDFVEIPDTLEDPRMADNPLCIDPSLPLRFYAGALLKTEDDLPIGTLCVLDTRPRVLTDLQRDTIRVLAMQVMKQLDLRLSLRRQDVLGREVDHRVKNSLAMVASTVRLQARRVDDPAAKAALAATELRVEAVAALHRAMHMAGGSDRIALDGFMAIIADSLGATVPDGVTLDIAFPTQAVPSSTASALAMIVNEFVTNSARHGFPEGRGGTVSIRGQIDGETLLVEATDDGVGNSGAADPATDRKPGLGARIIESSAASIGGELSTGLTADGARLTLRVPLDGEHG